MSFPASPTEEDKNAASQRHIMSNKAITKAEATITPNIPA